MKRQPEKLNYCAFKLKAHTKGSLKAEKMVFRLPLCWAIGAMDALRHFQAASHHFPRFRRVLFQIMNKRFFHIGLPALFHQFGGRAHRQHAPAVHQADAVAAFHFVHKVGGNENGDAVLAREFEQGAPKHGAGGGVNA